VTDATAMRLDRFLWFARLTRTRAWAQALAATGHLRIDGRPVDRPAAPVRIGNVLTFATHGGGIRTIRVLALPGRRGPAPEARTCYEDLALANVSQQAALD
jgi:ribosome-associated heat shock protein Hsp15